MTETPISRESAAPARPPILPHAAKGWLWLIAKLVVSAAILAIALSRVDFAQVGGAFARLTPALYAAALAAMFAANCLAGVRWSLLTTRLEARLRPLDAVGLYLASMFVGQILPSTLGVDAVRAWLTSRTYRPLSQVFGAIVVDRIAGMVGLGLLLLVGAPRLYALGDKNFGQAAMFAVALLALGVAFVVAATLLLRHGRFTGRLARLQEAGLTMLRAAGRRAGMIALAVSAVVHVLVTVSVILIAASLHAPIAAADGFATIPAAMLIATIPISINGWGLREGAMIACLGLAGVSASDAFVVSVLFGIGQFFAALPGAAYWVFARKTAPG
jgi:glycosyltransferase 2 family protein